ncbi:MAG: MFS transporter [Nitrososphaerota archaeon]|nr:MFS transporter [Nitrososphaerota archaeon]MDG6939306.1 MFS transporter [Nitrososphaerota archaeon]
MGTVSRNVRLLAAARVLTTVGFSSTIPFLALYLTVERGTSLPLVGLMYLLQGLAGLVSQVLSGFLADRIGPKRAMALGYVFSAAGAIYMAFLIHATAPTELIIVTYPLFSVLRGLSSAPSAALVADDRSDTVTGFSLLVMAGNLGFALGPAIGGLLVAYIGYAQLFLMSALTSVVGLALSAFMAEGTYHLQKEKQSSRPGAEVGAFLLLSLLGYLVIGQDLEPFALFAGNFVHASTLEVGYLFSFSGGLIVAAQLPSMRLLRRHGPYPSLLLGSALAAIACAWIGLSGDVPDLFVGMALITLAEIFFVVPSQMWITQRSPKGRKGAYQGYFAAVRSGGRSGAAWLGSTMMGVGEPGYAWFVMAGLAVALGAGYGLHMKAARAGASGPGERNAYHV